MVRTGLLSFLFFFATGSLVDAGRLSDSQFLWGKVSELCIYLRLVECLHHRVPSFQAQWKLLRMPCVILYDHFRVYGPARTGDRRHCRGFSAKMSSDHGCVFLVRGALTADFETQVKVPVNHNPFSVCQAGTNNSLFTYFPVQPKRTRNPLSSRLNHVYLLNLEQPLTAQTQD